MDERKWLFTDSDADLRGNLAAKVLINKAESKNWLNALNYDDASKRGENSNDVHHEIAEFVVDTALFHRELENTGSGLIHPAQAKLYERVFSRWNSLSDDVKAFYKNYARLEKKDASGSFRETTDLNDYIRAGSDRANYRIALVKSGATPLIGQALPQVIPGESNRIFFRTASVGSGPSRFEVGSISADSSSRNFLRDLYQSVYSSGTAANNVAVEKSNNTRFNLNVDDLVRKRMFLITQAEVKDSEPSLEEEAMINMVDRDVVKRDSEGLYVEVDGVKRRLGAADDETKRILKSAHSCYSTGVKAGSDAQCKRFIFECLLSQDANSLDQCLVALKSSPDFFKVATDDIKNIHPTLALRILQQFGFRKYQAHDATAGQQLWKVESVKHWLENYMTKKFSSQEVKEMITQKDQSYLLEYLKLVSDYVNANPAILNKLYSGKSDESVGVLKKTALGHALGLEFEAPRNLSDRVRVDYGMLRSRLQLRRETAAPVFVSASNRRFLSTPFGSSLTPGFSMLRGGGNCDQTAAIYVQNQGSGLLEQFLKSALENLKKRGKSLNSKDLEKIEMHIANNKKIETELVKTYCYLDEYNHLLDVLGDYSSKNLSVDTLKQLVSRQDVLLGKQGVSEDQIMTIFSKLLTLLGEEGEEMAPIKASDAL